MGEYTEGIERINIELSLANKLALVDRARGVLQRAATCRSARATTPSEIAIAELLEDRVQQALAAAARRRRASGAAG